MADKLMADIAGGEKKLQHVDTEDKSAPKIDADIHIKENKHGDLMADITGEKKLQHVETVDKSAPKIEGLCCFLSLFFFLFFLFPFFF